MLFFCIYSANLPIEAIAIQQNTPITTTPVISTAVALDELVSVPDEALRGVLLFQLGIQPNKILTKQDMEMLTSLTITNNISMQIHSLGVLIKFAAEQGHELAKSATITGKIGESYTVTARKG